MTHIIFNSIKVKSIDSSSGIFVSSNNYANNWTSQSKSNYGFGKVGENNVLTRCYTVVHDDDFIDSPMRDESTTVDIKKSIAQKTDIDFKEIKIDELDSNAAISIGETAQQSWKSSSKNNFGNGKFVGRTNIPQNQSNINDSDIIDSPVKNQHLTQTSLEDV